MRQVATTESPTAKVSLTGLRPLDLRSCQDNGLFGKVRAVEVEAQLDALDPACAAPVAASLHSGVLCSGHAGLNPHHLAAVTHEQRAIGLRRRPQKVPHGRDALELAQILAARQIEPARHHDVIR